MGTKNLKISVVCTANVIPARKKATPMIICIQKYMNQLTCTRSIRAEIENHSLSPNKPFVCYYYLSAQSPVRGKKKVPVVLVITEEGTESGSTLALDWVCMLVVRCGHAGYTALPVVFVCISIQ